MKQEKENTSFILLVHCRRNIIGEGFTENFVMTNNELLAKKNGKYYNQYEAKVLSRFCFESYDKKEMGSIIYH